MAFIPVNEPLLDGNEKKYLVQCVETGWISSEGPFVQQFEKGMAAKVGRKHGVAVCNGTAALDIAVAALELKPGDEMPSERVLMERFGVGRPAIREAMQALANMGLVNISHGERAKVLQLTAKSLFRQVDLTAKIMLSQSTDSLEHLIGRAHV